MKSVVIGLGVMGKHHARVHSEIGSLCAVVDTDVHRARAAGLTYKVPYFSSVEDLLKSSCRPQAASVVTPTYYHFDTCTKLLSNDIHVLCEKPFTGGTSAARSLQSLANRNGLHLQIGYIEQYNPVFIALKRLWDYGSFGTVTSVNIKRVGGQPRSATDVVSDLMSHDINLLLSLFGKEPTESYIVKSGRDGITDSAQAMFDFGGPSATCETNWISPIKIRHLHVTGTKGYCEVDLLNKTITKFESNVDSFPIMTVIGNDLSPISVSHSSTLTFRDEPLKLQLKAFLENCRTKPENKSVDQAIETIEVLELLSTIPARNT